MPRTFRCPVGSHTAKSLVSSRTFSTLHEIAGLHTNAVPFLSDLVHELKRLPSAEPTHDCWGSAGLLTLPFSNRMLSPSLYASDLSISITQDLSITLHLPTTSRSTSYSRPHLSISHLSLTVTSTRSLSLCAHVTQISTTTKQTHKRRKNTLHPSTTTSRIQIITFLLHSPFTRGCREYFSITLLTINY